ncbi:MAG TPA: bifunctional oligoribonuclease/PAP phosphatase NrnA [Desulfatiglandales bacterium]|nr:bifunctional oligoribonuclease/PAP phosphatase NrnA [Desulfatiglandales bacterium]
MVLNNIADILKNSKRLFLASHKDPDGDAIGSLLALGLAFALSGKEVVFFNEGPISNSLSLLKGAGKIVNSINRLIGFDAFFVLDCGSLERVGSISSRLSKVKPLINIDHHINNAKFGDFNLVEAGSSSVGEIIYRLIKSLDLPMNLDIAENIFVAIQTDTGSFRYGNTTKEAFSIAGKMMGWGVNPWEAYRRVIDGYTLKQIRVLESALKTIELHYSGKIGLMTVTQEMLLKTGADNFDSEKLVDHIRFVSGVEIGVLIREIGNDFYKFSIRSNDWVNVADIAAYFGGGGHPRAAAFMIEGGMEAVKQEFLNKAIEFLEKR